MTAGRGDHTDECFEAINRLLQALRRCAFDNAEQYDMSDQNVSPTERRKSRSWCWRGCRSRAAVPRLHRGNKDRVAASLFHPPYTNVVMMTAQPASSPTMFAVW